jgi:hypothetical protein
LPAGRVAGEGQTEPGSPISAERATAILQRFKDNPK